MRQNNAALSKIVSLAKTYLVGAIVIWMFVAVFCVWVSTPLDKNAFSIESGPVPSWVWQIPTIAALSWPIWSSAMVLGLAVVTKSKALLSISSLVTLVKAGFGNDEAVMKLVLLRIMRFKK